MHESNPKPPGPRGLPLVGSLPIALQDPLAFWLDLTLHYGPIAYARIAWFDLYMLNTPELVTQMLVTHHRVCIKDQSALPELLQFTGRGLMSLEGEEWRMRRKLAAPALSPKRVTAYVDTVVELTTRLANQLTDSGPRDFHRDAMRLALNVAAKTLLGVDVGPDADRLGQIMDLTLAYFTKRMFRLSQRLIPASLPTHDQRAFRAAVADLDAIVFRMLARCRADANSDTLLADLLRARDEQGRALTDQELRDEVVTMLVAGHETSALTLTYAVYELSRHPAHLQRLRDEVERLAPGRTLQRADLPQLVWTEAVVKETLRLYPPGHALSRKLLAPLELGGYKIPAGSLVCVSPYAMHRHPSYFPDPEQFRPERWQEGADALPRGCYLPFGDGPRICVGNHFAIAELKLMLGTLLRQLDIQVAPDYQLKLDPGITLRPVSGLPVTIHPYLQRRAADSARPASS
jgi:cytochrome P450